MNESDRIEAGIAALEAQREQLGDAVVDTALESLREKLTALQGREQAQQLKQVSVLFADIVGSTSLSRSLDPEEVHIIVNGAMERFTAIVKIHRGRVLQYAGDSALAVFGADVAHEDDAERAVLAGLDLISEAARLGEEVRLRHGHDGFGLRVGIHTGPVLLGGGVDGEGSIRGFAVNIAARMEQSAPVGRLRISQDTYRHVRGVFDVEQQPPLEIKGGEGPMATYLVIGTKPRAFRVARRGIDGVETRMVGRDADLAQLGSMFERATKDGVLACITLVADAGLGKSRLMFEFEHWIDMRPEEILLFQGRGQPQGINQPYAVLRDMLYWRFEIRDSDTFNEVHQKLIAALGPILGTRGEEQTALLGQLIGLDYHASPYVVGILHDGKQVRDRAFHAIAQYFRLLWDAKKAPIVMLLDDLHWADSGSLDLIDYLIRTCPDLPMLVLCGARPVLYERRPHWGNGQRQHTRIDLPPLPRRDSRELAEALLSRVEAPPPMLLDLITAGAEGNPFYMEELTQMLIDDGALVTGPDRWHVVPEKLLRVHLPATLTGVLQARLDSLPPQDKGALQLASVIGHVFWDAALAHLSQDAVQAVPRLVQRDLTQARDTTSFDGTREYVFKHHALHQVTYDSILKRQRREQHRLTGEWISGRSGERINEFSSLIADHYERAGETFRASGYWHQAAEHALQRFALDSALAYAERGLATSDPTDLPRRYALTLVRFEAHARTQARDLQATELDELERLATSLNDDLKRSQAAERRAAFLITGGDYAASLPAAQQALAWSAGRDAGLEARAQNAMTLAMARLGRYDVAKKHAHFGLALAQAGADATAHANLLQNMGLILIETGDSVGAAGFFEQALVVCRKTGDRFSECRALNGLADTCRSLGDYAAARTQMLELICLCQDVGIRIFEGYGHLNLALVLVHLGEPQLALEHAGKARAILNEGGDRWAEGSSRVNAGHARLALGQLNDARMEYEAARTVFDSLDGPHMALEPMAGLAAVALAEGNAASALVHVEEILARLANGASLDGTDEPLRVRLSCFHTLRATQDPRAHAVLALAHEEIMARADKIKHPAARSAFLLGTSSHREIVEAWTASGTAAIPAGV